MGIGVGAGDVAGGVVGALDVCAVVPKVLAGGVEPRAHPARPVRAMEATATMAAARRRSGLAKGLSSVDYEGVAHGEGGVVAAEPQHGRGDFLGSAESADGLLLHHAL